MSFYFSYLSPFVLLFLPHEGVIVDIFSSTFPTITSTVCLVKVKLVSCSNCLCSKMTSRHALDFPVSGRHKRRRVAASTINLLRAINDGQDESISSDQHETCSLTTNSVENECPVSHVSQIPAEILFGNNEFVPAENEPSEPSSIDESVDDDGAVIPTFRDLLASWAVECQVPQLHVDRLLKIMKHIPDHANLNLPDSCRTLLKTVRKTPLTEVPPGHFFYLGICESLKSALKKQKIKLRHGEVLHLLIGIDGIPISRSSGSQFWPILCLIRYKSGSKPFLIGIYHGYQKPEDVNLFLSDFTREMLSLQETGMLYDDKVIQITIDAFICDAPAKAFITSIKSHSGYFGCSKCIEEGDHLGSVVFLNEHAPLRTNESFRRRTQEDHHHQVRSILENLPIDMISCFPLDYMHLVCLGVMRKLLGLWCNGPLSVRIGPVSKRSINNLLSFIAHYFPVEFARKVRSLDELPRWKATEFRSFLLYVGPIVLKNILPSDLYNHFMMLHVAIKILVNKDLCHQFNNYAKTLLVSFVSLFRDLYGEQFVSYNVHNLIHLADDVQILGHLDSFSAFPFENHLQIIKKLLRKHDRPLPQVVRRVVEIEANFLCPTNVNENQYILKRHHRGGPLIFGCNGRQFREFHFNGIVLKCDVDADCCARFNESIVKIANIIETCEGIFFVGQEYREITNFYNIPLESSRLDTYSVKRLCAPRIWPLSTFKFKVVRIPSRLHSNSFVIYPLHIQ